VSKNKENQKQKNKESTEKIENPGSSLSQPQLKIRKLGTQRVRRKTNLRFFIVLAIWAVALIIGLLFVSGKL
jgi:hypothetical protein